MNKAISKKVFVGMSGGVDSSVTALLLKKRGYDVTGIFMRCWGGGSSSSSLGITHSPELGVSCAERDAEDARRVAGHLGIPFYVWDFEEEYKKRVVAYMIEGYKNGLTPNPDVMCNREIKFGLFLEKALRMGADYVATGHYVRLRRTVAHGTRHFALCAAKDKNKDQSYFLWTLTQAQLKHCLFPIGDHLKPQVRVIAKKAGLSTAEKKDSQGICFLGDVSIADFLRSYLPEKRGVVLTTTGETIGEHTGAWFYTIGQRHIGLANRRPTQTERGQAQKKDLGRLYVTEKDVKKNTLTVAEGDTHEALYRKEVRLYGVNFITGSFNSNVLKNVGIKVMARVRYRQPLAKATLFVGVRSKKSEARIIFEHAQKFVAEGQSTVFYDKKGQILGGGVIVEK